MLFIVSQTFQRMLLSSKCFPYLMIFCILNICSPVSIHLFIHSFFLQSFCPSIHHPSIHLSTHPSSHPYICPSVLPPICPLSILPFISHPSYHPSIFQFFCWLSILPSPHLFFIHPFIYSFNNYYTTLPFILFIWQLPKETVHHFWLQQSDLRHLYLSPKVENKNSPTR